MWWIQAIAYWIAYHTPTIMLRGHYWRLKEDEKSVELYKGIILQHQKDYRDLWVKCLPHIQKLHDEEIDAYNKQAVAEGRRPKALYDA